MLMVICFEDEMVREDLDLFFEDLEETGLYEVRIFDDGAKAVIGIPDEIPDPDHTGTLEDYWIAVMNETLCPCCHPIENTQIAVHSIYKLDVFRKNDKDINDGEGIYADVLDDLEE